MSDETTTETQDVEDQTGDVEQTPEQETEGQTFPRAYVEELRGESAKYRREAREAREAVEPLERRLHALLVGATGRVADPSDVPFDRAHLDDAEALDAALSDLLARKPHLAARVVRGDIGQGAGSGSGGSFSLAGLLSRGA